MDTACLERHTTDIRGCIAADGLFSEYTGDICGLDAIAVGTKGRKKKRAAVADGGVCLHWGRLPTAHDAASRNLSSDGVAVLVVDESNSFGDKAGRRRTRLTLVCATTPDGNRYADTSRLIPLERGSRKKYYNTREPELSMIVRDIASQDITVYETDMYIDYDGTSGHGRKRSLYIDMMKLLLGSILELNPDMMVDIVIDVPPVESNLELNKLCSELILQGFRIRWFETRHSAGARLLQTHDYTTGVVSDWIESIEGRKHLALHFDGKLFEVDGDGVRKARM